MLTRDGDILDVRFTVSYQIRQPTDYLFHSVDPELTITRAAQAALRGIVGARSTDALLQQDREAMRQQLTTSVQKSLDAL